MNALRRLLEACVAFAVCNLALATYMAMAADTAEMAAARDWTGMATFAAALFVGLGTLISSVGALIISFRNLNKIAAVTELTHEIKLNTNSMSERLERQAELAGAARGKDEAAVATERENTARAEGKAEGAAAVVPAAVAAAGNVPLAVVTIEPVESAKGPAKVIIAPVKGSEELK